MSAVQKYLDRWMGGEFVTTPQAIELGVTRGRLQYLGKRGVIDHSHLDEFQGPLVVWKRAQVVWWATHDGKLPPEFTDARGHWMCVALMAWKKKIGRQTINRWINEGCPRLFKANGEGGRVPQHIHLESETGQERTYVLESEFDEINKTLNVASDTGDWKTSHEISVLTGGYSGKRLYQWSKQIAPEPGIIAKPITRQRWPRPGRSGRATVTKYYYPDAKAFLDRLKEHTAKIDVDKDLVTARGAEAHDISHENVRRWHRQKVLRIAKREWVLRGHKHLAHRLQHDWFFSLKELNGISHSDGVIKDADGKVIWRATASAVARGYDLNWLHHSRRSGKIHAEFVKFPGRSFKRPTLGWDEATLTASRIKSNTKDEKIPALALVAVISVVQGNHAIVRGVRAAHLLSPAETAIVKVLIQAKTENLPRMTNPELVRRTNNEGAARTLRLLAARPEFSGVFVLPGGVKGAGYGISDQ